MTAVEIREIAEKYEMDYSIVGIRTQEEPFRLGELAHVSSVWEDGEETNQVLPGISVTDVNSEAVKMHTGESWNSYYGEHVAIVCGDAVAAGEDAGEMIITNAIVVEIIK